MVTLQHAYDSSSPLSEMTPNGKARLKMILSDPDPGNPWKLDDPVWVPGEDPPIPHNYWARGALLELDAYKRIYKPDGPKWVQGKSPSNPNATEIGLIDLHHRLSIIP